MSSVPGVAKVRGRGLLLAAVLAEPVATHVAAAALDEGLVVNAVAPDALRLAPPLLVSDDELEEAVSILGTVLQKLALSSSEEVTQP